MPTGSGSGGTADCCKRIYDFGDLSGNYKTKCCNNGTFRKSTTGQSVCCSSEPSDSSLKANCCKDNGSRNYCDLCEAWKNGNYTYTGSETVTGPKACCDNWGASTVGANSTLKSKCCANAAWAPANPGTCCDLSSVQNSYLGACCNYWRDNSQTSHKDTCCGNDGWKKANNTEGKWCYEPPACSLTKGVHTELTCKRDSAYSYNITCTATSDPTYGFTYALIAKNTSGTTYGFGVPTGGNGSNTVTQSNVSKITGLTVTTNGFNADLSGLSFSFKGNNEYNVGITVNTSCKASIDFENMCQKMISCSGGSSCTSAYLSYSCTSTGCTMSACPTAAYPDMGSSGWGKAKRCCDCGSGCGGYSWSSLETGQGKCNCGGAKTGNWKYMGCAACYSGGAGTKCQTTNLSSPSSSCSATYTP